MTAILPFTTWICRFTNEEYSLMWHRMHAIQWIGPNIQRRFDIATSSDSVDLDDPIMPLFKQALIDEHVLSPARADIIFSRDGASPTLPTGAAAGMNGQVQYNNSGTLGGAANFMISSGDPNVAAGHGYLYDGANVIHGDTIGNSFYFGYSGLSATGAYNLTFGYGSGRNLTTGTNNLFIGYGSGSDVSTGSYNMIIGPYAGAAGLNYAFVMVDGLGNNVLSQLNNNIAIGYLSGNIQYANGQSNTSIGIYAGQRITSGDNNTCIGFSAGANAVSGNFNTLVGSNSGFDVTGGSYNTFIGSGYGGSAGSAVSTGSYNVIIGGYVGTAALFDHVILSDGVGTIVVDYDNQTRTWTTTITTVGALPAAGVVGRRAFVTDAVASSFFTMATGGGTMKVPVFDDGVNWRIG